MKQSSESSGIIASKSKIHQHSMYIAFCSRQNKVTTILVIFKLNLRIVNKFMKKLFDQFSKRISLFQRNAMGQFIISLKVYFLVVRGQFYVSCGDILYCGVCILCIVQLLVSIVVSIVFRREVLSILLPPFFSQTLTFIYDVSKESSAPIVTS